MCKCTFICCISCCIMIMYIYTLFIYRVRYNSVTGLILTLCDMNIFAILQSYAISLVWYSVSVLFPILLVCCWKNKKKSILKFAGIIARLPCYLHLRLWEVALACFSVWTLNCSCLIWQQHFYFSFVMFDCVTNYNIMAVVVFCLC